METAEELRTLIELGVPLAQGYYLSRPAAPWPTVPVGVLAAAGGEAQAHAVVPTAVKGPALQPERAVRLQRI
jgi:EAL domain-containing protein (putative c-di-GMP-specific phosphodiesterase class I)